MGATTCHRSGGVAVRTEWSYPGLCRHCDGALATWAARVVPAERTNAGGHGLGVNLARHAHFGGGEINPALGNAGQVSYVASKAGLIGLTKTAAKELAPRGITVNAIAPGFIETDMTASLPENVRKAMLSQVPLGRPGKPEDVAAAVAFLVSEAAAYITGQVLHVSGGMYI